MNRYDNNYLGNNAQTMANPETMSKMPNFNVSIINNDNLFRSNQFNNPNNSLTQSEYFEFSNLNSNMQGGNNMNSMNENQQNMEEMDIEKEGNSEEETLGFRDNINQEGIEQKISLMEELNNNFTLEALKKYEEELALYIDENQVRERLDEILEIININTENLFGNSCSEGITMKASENSQVEGYKNFEKFICKDGSFIPDTSNGNPCLKNFVYKNGKCEREMLEMRCKK